MAEELTIEQEMDALDSVLDTELASLDAEEEDELESEEDKNEKEVPPETEQESQEDDEEDSDTQEDQTQDTSDADTQEDTQTQEESQTPDTDDRYSQLLAQINDLQGQLKSTSDTKEPAGDSSEVVDYLKDLTMDDLDITQLNKIFNSIATQARENAETYLKSQTSNLISNQINDRMTSREITDQFYSVNKDLLNVRNVVKACAEQIVQEHDDWNIEQVLKESATRTRTSLGLPTPSEKDLPSSDKAAFAGGSKGSRKKAQNISALQRELDEL